MNFSAVLQDIPWRKHFHRNYLYLTGIVCGIVLGRDLPGIYLAALLLTALTIWLIRSKLYREVLMLLLAATAGLLAVVYQKYTADIFRSSRLEDAVVTVADSGAVGPVWLPGDLHKNRITANYDGKTIQLYLPDKLNCMGLFDGRKYTVSGNLYALEPPTEFFMADANGGWKSVNSSFRRSNYNDYLVRNGIGSMLFIEKIEPLPESRESRLACIRRTLAQRLDKNIADPVNRAILGAVTLGLRHRLTGTEKQHYASVGLAHLFSISGLHIGVLAAIVLLLMRPMPRWLTISATGTLIGYVYLTGNNAPAIRAFAMVMVLVAFRAYFLRCRPLETLSAICGVFLLADPLYLTDGGFLYSFIITAVLIKSSALGRDIVRTFSGPEYLIGKTSRMKTLFCRWRGRAAGAVFFAAMASAASSTLTLFFQNMFFAGSMIVNLLVLPILLPLYLLAIGKMILPQWADCWNVPLNLLVDYLKFIAGLGSEFTGGSELMHISYLAVVLFVLLLMLAITAAKHKAVLAISLLLFAVTGFMHLKSCLAPQNVYALIWGGNIEKPVAAVIRPQAHTMYLLNCNYDAVMPLLDIAAFYGISQIDRLDFGNPVAGCANGLIYLAKNMPIHKYRKSPLPIRSRLFKEYTNKLQLLPGGQINSLSVFNTNKPDMKFELASDGTLTLYCADKKYSIERTRYPQAYIIEQDCPL